MPCRADISPPLQIQGIVRFGRARIEASLGCYNRNQHLAAIKSVMTVPSQSDVTGLLLAWSDGDRDALHQLTPLVYQELRRLAKRHMVRERPGHTLQATALVNEAYLRLIDINRMRWQNRAHFFAVSAQMMRRILVEFARNRHRRKRGGEAERVTFDDSLEVMSEAQPDLVAMDDALNALEAIDARLSQVVELRFFGGLTVEETAEVMKLSPQTVNRDWKTAKVWLFRELNGGKSDGI
jgi:RNA polymerase sigma factor (TIGR02999 family)